MTFRGPVRTVQTQFAEWDPESGDWQPLRTRAVESFRRDGQLGETEYHNPDGSTSRHIRIYDDSGRLTEEQWRPHDVLTKRSLHTYDAQGRPASLRTVDADGTERETERYRYDDRGRKTKVALLVAPERGGANAVHYGIEGTDTAYSAPGATTSITSYDERGLPSEVSFVDAQGATVSRVLFSRDGDGRLLSERLESMTELTAFEDRTVLVATYAYDEKGRQNEIVRRLGQLAEDRTTLRYDDFDNPVEQVCVDGSCVRFEYQYDACGNWTERVAWARTGPGTDERRSSIERRTITYYGVADRYD